MIKEIKNTMLWAYVFGDLSGKEIVGVFYEKELRIEDKTKRIKNRKSN